MENSELHVVLGAGQVGLLLARLLLERGRRVRIVRRGTPGPSLPGLEWLQGDVSDPAFAARACAGATVVYNCTNPQAYHRWEQILPPLQRGVREGVRQSGARLVALDNLYMVGAPASAPFDEEAPLAPCSKKGELRARLHQELMASGIPVAVGRASDFFGPGADRAAVFGSRLAERLPHGRAVEVIGDPDQPHSYHYIPDVARGLMVLGEHESALGRVWHLPCAWQGTTRELLDALAASLGVRARTMRVPTWLLRVAGLFSGELGAVAEMVYQWRAPFLADDRRFRAAFGVEPTPVAEAVAATAAWLRGEAVMPSASAQSVPG